MIQQPTLIFARHGNTFEAGQQAVWVGARTDMRLTQQGETQAQRGILYITQKFPWVSSIVAGPLRRTTSAAAIMAAHLGKEHVVDRRLCEIDYGKWEGLSNAQIIERFGIDTLEHWEQHGIWPTDMNWQPSLPTLLSMIEDFLNEQREKLKAGNVSRVAVTSNGILRLVRAVVTGDLSDPSSKVKTGNLCSMVPTENGWQITGWDINPV